MVTDTYTKRATWVLRSPDHRLHSFMDLKGFVKENQHLFHPRDVMWDHPADGGTEWCPAYAALGRLHPHASAQLPEWKGWSWFGERTDRPRTPAGGATLPQNSMYTDNMDYKPSNHVLKKPIERLCNAREVSQILNIPLSSVYHLRKTGQLEVIRIGGRYRFERSKVLAIREGTAGPPNSDELGYRHTLNEMITRTSKLLRELTILGRDYDNLVSKQGAELGHMHAH